jgi:diaminopimelate decarboxylase
MKANSNLAILDILAREGAGFDIVSGGELLRVIAAGGDPGKVIFSGVGKTVAEIELALDKGILCFNVESIPELHRINEVAGRIGKRAPVSLRVNPNVDPKTHPYIATGLKASKFGVAFSTPWTPTAPPPRCRTWTWSASTATSARSCWTTRRCWKRWTS